jgi:hypothetical protein
LGTRTQRWSVVWRDNLKPADFAEWEAIVAAAIEPYPGNFGVGFYETAQGWSFTTGWLDVTGVESEARGPRVAGGPSAIRRPIHQALTRAGKPLAGDAHVRAGDPGGSAETGPVVGDEVRGSRVGRPTSDDEPFTDAQVDTLARIADGEGSALLIRRLAAEVRALREELKKARPAIRDGS